MEGIQTDVLLVVILYITLIYEILDGIRRKSQQALQPVKGNNLHSRGRQTASEIQHKPKIISPREDAEIQPIYRNHARRESTRHFVQMRLIGRG